MMNLTMTKEGTTSNLLQSCSIINSYTTKSCASVKNIASSYVYEKNSFVDKYGSGKNFLENLSEVMKRDSYKYETGRIENNRKTTDIEAASLYDKINDVREKSTSFGIKKTNYLKKTKQPKKQTDEITDEHDKTKDKNKDLDRKSRDMNTMEEILASILYSVSEIIMSSVVSRQQFQDNAEDGSNRNFLFNISDKAPKMSLITDNHASGNSLYASQLLNSFDIKDTVLFNGAQGKSGLAEFLEMLGEKIIAMSDTKRAMQIMSENSDILTNLQNLTFQADSGLTKSSMNSVDNLNYFKDILNNIPKLSASIRDYVKEDIFGNLPEGISGSAVYDSFAENLKNALLDVFSGNKDIINDNNIEILQDKHSLTNESSFEKMLGDSLQSFFRLLHWQEKSSREELFMAFSKLKLMLQKQYGLTEEMPPAYLKDIGFGKMLNLSLNNDLDNGNQINKTVLSVLSAKDINELNETGGGSDVIKIRGEFASDKAGKVDINKGHALDSEEESAFYTEVTDSREYFNTEGNSKDVNTNMPFVLLNGTTGKVQGSLKLKNSTMAEFQKDIIGQVLDGAKIILDGQKAELTMVLEPESLGKLSLKIATENGIVTARFIAESYQVKSAIEANMQTLHDMLSSQGFSVQGFSVEVRQQNERNNNEKLNEQNFLHVKALNTHKNISAEAENYEVMPVDWYPTGNTLNINA